MSSQMDYLDRFKGPWIDALKQPGTTCPADFPSYPPSEPEPPVSASCPVSFELGTGASIYTGSLLPAIVGAKREVILVTCFWAPSSTLTALRESLEQLAKLRRDHVRSHPPSSRIAALSPLDVRICFSSRSFFQKLFHPWSRDGYTYLPSKWTSQLGLPDPKLLEAGLINLQVKSLFFLPFSVMHPKFLIVDRQKAWLPSSNVSWESWLEGCVEITGDAVVALLRFYRSVWDRHSEVGRQAFVDDDPPPQMEATPNTGGKQLAPVQSPASCTVTLRPSVIPTILLPSSHRRNPYFRPFPWQRNPSPPKTPLNCAILRLIAMAEKKIYIQTPNLTSAAVIDALLGALNRGVDVTVVTSKGMMTLEQLLTSGTTTSQCLRSFVRLYKRHKKRRVTDTRPSNDIEVNTVLDLEAGLPGLGQLEIFYFHPLAANRLQQVSEEPVHSHLKLTMVDEEITVLGSGNMDRASWFTSQELGVLFQSSEFATNVSNAVSQVLQGRLALVFSSRQDE